MCEKEKEIILYKETFLQSIVSDFVTFSGILGCLYVTEKTGSVFWTTVSIVMLVVVLIPFGGNKHKFRSRKALLEYLQAS